MRPPFRGIVLCCAIGTVLICARSAAAQAPPPLDKAELVRLLTNPLFAQAEVADVVRRSCLSFHPTERDWADLRNAGASGEVIASAAACDDRHATPAAAPRAASRESVQPITAVAIPAELISSAGAASSVRVRLSRGRTPLKGTVVALNGTTALGLVRDAAAMTDDSGIAVFHLPPVSRLGTYQFPIRSGSGEGFPGQPAVLLSVTAGRPNRLRVSPEVLDFGRGDSTVTVIATLTDSLGNGLAGEPIEANGMSNTPITAVTDSAGRANFVVTAASVQRGSKAQIRARGLAPVDIEIAGPAGLSGVNTGFMPLSVRRSPVGSLLTEPLVFRARTVQGAAAADRTVRFRALNATVTPESAVLDTTGRVSVQVVLGVRAGEAAVFARIDSIERIVTLRADPGPIDTLILERNGESVNGRSIAVPVGTTFVLRLRAQDLYGNTTSLDPFGAALRASQQQLSGKDQNLQLISLEFADSVAVFTLKARQLGTYNVAIGSGIKASVRVDAVR